MKTKPLTEESRERGVVRTLCRVKEVNGRKHWVVCENDSDPESIGEITACGMPVQANSVPVGSTFECILTIPDAV